jgi:hypothetical protein
MPTPEDDAEPLSAPSAAAEDGRRHEGPFTDYGQFGVDYLDTRVLWQDQVWVDRTGTPHALHDMSRQYLSNVLAYLHGRAAEWYLEALLNATAVLAQATAREVSPEAHQETVTRAERVLALDPSSWIEETPLVGALRLWLAAAA